MLTSQTPSSHMYNGHRWSNNPVGQTTKSAEIQRKNHKTTIPSQRLQNSKFKSCNHTVIESNISNCKIPKITPKQKKQRCHSSGLPQCGSSCDSLPPQKTRAQALVRVVKKNFKCWHFFQPNKLSMETFASACRAPEGAGHSSASVWGLGRVSPHWVFDLNQWSILGGSQQCFEPYNVMFAYDPLSFFSLKFKVFQKCVEKVATSGIQYPKYSQITPL